jgi:hypothetical protein
VNRSFASIIDLYCLHIFTTIFIEDRAALHFLNSGGIWTVYGLDGPGSISGSAGFSLLHTVQTGCRPHPTSYLKGTGVSLSRE